MTLLDKVGGIRTYPVVQRTNESYFSRDFSDVLPNYYVSVGVLSHPTPFNRRDAGRQKIEDPVTGEGLINDWNVIGQGLLTGSLV